MKGKGSADAFGSRHSKNAAAAEIAKRDSDLRAQYVIVPPGDEAQTISCPICKETLKSEFLEDDEEWVWKNATKKDDKVISSVHIVSPHLMDWLDLPCDVLCRGYNIHQYPGGSAAE